MKRILQHLSLIFVTLCCITTLPGCHDDKPEINPGEEIIDDFTGPYYEFMLGQETEGLGAGVISILIQGPDGTEFERIATHSRSNSSSQFKLTSGLREGIYRLLAITAGGDQDGETEFGLGSRISVTSSGISVIDAYNPQLGFAGRGIKDDPYIVSSPSHLFNLMMAVNDYDSNRLITADTYFSQVRNLDMKSVSRNCDLEYGWLPIGMDPNIPFRGVYLGGNHSVSNLMIKRPASSGLGLFGYVIDATIDGLKMKNCTVEGMYGVGSIAGVVLTSGERTRGKASFTNCTISDSQLKCPDTSAAIGGVVGAVDMHAMSLVSSCTISNSTLSGGMNVGGLIGGAGLYSSVTATDVACEGSHISSKYSGAGGIIGSADTLQVVSARNLSEINGSLSSDASMPRIGTGGIAGGAGYAWLTACRNSAEVNGCEGVGGIIGSTRVKGSEKESFLYNQAYLRHCSNTGNITGKRMAGGLVGEAQSGVESGYNTGKVSAEEYAGGICGNSSIAVIMNAVNSGEVTANKYVGGVLAKTTWGSLANCQNLASVRANSGPSGGILGLGGNNTMIHYCSNFGVVQGADHNAIGGIVGEIGDPREWTALNIVECVVGSMEIAMSFIGPAIAVVEETVELAHGVEITIKAIEKIADLALMSADYALFSYGLPELISPETEDALKIAMEEGVYDTYSEIDSELSQLRSRISVSAPLFPSANFSPYVSAIESLTSACADEETSNRLQAGINEAREKRGEQLEKVARAHEIAHTVVSGVAIAVSTATFIAGTVASGGAASVVLVAGTAAAFVGGANALVKTCSEFENNAVVISQCVNAAPVIGNSTEISSIAGKICDGVQINDCLNTADTSEGLEGIFIGKAGLHNEIRRCVSASERSMPFNPSNYHQCVSAKKASGDSFDYPDMNITLVAPAILSDPATYQQFGIEIGSDKTWNLPEGLPCPIPEKSCYL